MFPDFASDYIKDVRCGHAEFAGKISIANPSCLLLLYKPNIVFRQLCATMFRASCEPFGTDVRIMLIAFRCLFGMCMPAMMLASGSIFRMKSRAILIASSLSSFINHIARVISVRASAQMRRIDTGWIITAMQYTWFVIGRIPVAEKVGHARGTKDLIADTNSSVSVIVKRSHPNPAVTLRALSGCLIDFRPEAINVFLLERRDWFRIAVSHIQLLVSWILVRAGKALITPCRLVAILP